jgi:DNA-binding NarL/FixJ family response regulator
VIRVLIAGQGPVSQAGLAALLGSMDDVEVVGQLCGWGTLAARLVESSPQVVVADLGPAANELPPEIIGLLEQPGAPRVILLSGDAEETLTSEGLRAGAAAVLRRELTAGEIRGAVEAAAAGLTVIHAESVPDLLPAPALGGSSPDQTLVPELTPRELEVLRMLADGIGNKVIGSRLGISEHTVKFHVASILGKLRAASRTEAVAVGIRRGLILL